MAREIKDLDDAIDEQSDLIRELGRTTGCEQRAEEAQIVLDYMAMVRLKALKFKDVRALLDVK